ncbi:MAG: hypothetical protein WCL21_14630 [Mariniphaga sp.]
MKTTKVAVTCMKGKIQLNYLFGYPYVLSNSQGCCDLITTDDGLHMLRFEVKFPEFKVRECELFPLNEMDFQGIGFFVHQINCIQLSGNEILVGFTIFDERENYPDTIGGFARLRGTIPTTIQRKVLL